MEIVNNNIIIFLIIIVIGGLFLPVVDSYLEDLNNEKYRNLVELSKKNQYDLQDLIEINKLVVFRPDSFSEYFIVNEDIERVAENINNIEDLQRYIYYFPYCNNSSYFQPAIMTLKKGCGMCGTKSVLACTIAKAKNIPCYVIGKNHAISLIYDKGSYYPLFSTGYINSQEKLDKFMSELNIIYNENERFQYWLS